MSTSLNEKSHTSSSIAANTGLKERVYHFLFVVDPRGHCGEVHRRGQPSESRRRPYQASEKHNPI
jgi:hypothetical protein